MLSTFLLELKSEVTVTERKPRQCFLSFAELCLPRREVRAVTQIRTNRASTREPPSCVPQETGSLIKEVTRKKTHHMNQTMWGIHPSKAWGGGGTRKYPSESLDV